MLKAIWEGLNNTMALIVYMAMFLGGSVFTTFSLMLGGDADHGGDVHVDHGDVHAEHGGDSDHDDQGPSVFSIRGAALFMTGFGAIGFIVQAMTKKVLFSSVSGMLFGVLLANLGIMMVRASIRQQANSAVKPEHFTGAKGVVMTTIPPGGGYGEVRVSVRGTERSLMAKSKSGREIRSGTLVTVAQYAGSMIIVEPAIKSVSSAS